MKRTGPSDVDVLSCASAARPGRGPRLSLVALVRGDDFRIVQASDYHVAVDARVGVESLADPFVVVEEQRRREVRELERSEDSPFAPGIEQSRGNDRAASPTGARRALLRDETERHAVPLPEPVMTEHRPRRVVPPGEEPTCIFPQTDHHQAPRELLAIPPLEHT